MDDLRPTKRPKISPQSRIHKNNAAAKGSKPKGKDRQAVRSRNTGKLATLMDITLDIFFEVITHLRPVDLLQLCRVSKHFRTTFMSKTMRSFWVATRKNGDPLPVPDPLPGMSEPCFASLLFEHNCFACGIGRALKVDFALGLRFCAACAKMNLQEGYHLLGRYRDIPDLVLGLVPTQVDAIEGGTSLAMRKGSLYYVTEFEDVVKQYRELSQSKSGGQDLDQFMDRRREYVASVAKHAQAINEWDTDCNRIISNQGEEAQQRREASIKEKLFALGYSEDDFPETTYFGCPPAAAWDSIIGQPKALTERIWKNIHGKLVQAIEDYKVWRAEMEVTERRNQRRRELRLRQREWAQNLTDDDGPYPSFTELWCLPETIAIVNEDDVRIEIDQQRFDELVLPILQEYKISTRAAMVQAVRSVFPQSTDIAEDGPSEGRSQDDSEDILYGATALFANPHDHILTYSLVSRRMFSASEDVFSFRELLLELRDVYVEVEAFCLPEQKRAHYELDAGVVKTAQEILKAVGLPDNTLCEDVDGRIICLCGRTNFRQPASFSKLVNHVHQRRLRHQEILDLLEISPSTSKGPSVGFSKYKDHDDHDFDSDTPLFRLLDKDEEYTPSETDDALDDEMDLGGTLFPFWDWYL